MKFKQFDRVRLKDGREGDIMEILGNQEQFILTIGDSPQTWVDIDVSIGEIEKVIVKNDD